MIRNVSSNALLNLYRTGIQFGLQLVLSYFLAPSDYGLFALIAPITLLVLLVGDFGLTSAIVRAPTLEAGALGAAARISGLVGLAVLGVTVLVALTGLFDRVALHFGLLCVGFAVVVQCALLVSIPRAMLERNLRYSTIAVLESSVTTIAFVMAVAAAILHAGVWSYLVYHLTLQGLRMATLWVMQGRQIPIFSGSLTAALPLLTFGGWVLFSNIIGFVARNGDNYIVGGMLGAGALGIYAMAYQVMLFPVQTLTWPISSVLTATLSRLHDRPDLQRAATLSTIGLVALLSIPAGAFLFARAPLLFDVLLPPRWHAVGDVASRLALAGCIQSVTAFMGPLFIAGGRVRMQLIVSVVNTVTVLLAVALAARMTHDVVVVSQAYVALFALLSVWHLWLIGNMLGQGMLPVLRVLVPSVLASVAGLLASFVATAALKVTALPVECLIAIAGFGLGWGVVVAWQRGMIKRAVSEIRTAGTMGAEAVGVASN